MIDVVYLIPALPGNNCAQCDGKVAGYSETDVGHRLLERAGYPCEGIMTGRLGTMK
jgi:hypothetical protein